MASDSESTESGHTRFDVEKIWTTGNCLLMGYSGSGAVRAALAMAINNTVQQTFGDADEIDRWQARTALAGACKPVLEQYYGEFVSTQQPAEAVLGGALLVIGRDSDGHWILEIDLHNTATFYEERGLQAIGSGGSAAFIAQGLLRHYQPQDQTIKELRLIAYRTVKTCIDGLGGRLGVGGEVHLWSCESGGGYAKAGVEQIASLEEGLTKWTTIERESLDEVFAGAPPQQTAEAEAGVPEALDEEKEPVPDS